MFDIEITLSEMYYHINVVSCECADHTDLVCSSEYNVPVCPQFGMHPHLPIVLIFSYAFVDETTVYINLKKWAAVIGDLSSG